MQGEQPGRDLVVEISDFGRARANGRRKRGFPRVQRIGEPSNIALGRGREDCLTRKSEGGSD